MRRARENMNEDDYVVGNNERSEATRELEAFRLVIAVCLIAIVYLDSKCSNFVEQVEGET